VYNTINETNNRWTMSVETKIKIDYLSIKKASLVLRALNHKLRQQIVKMLDEKQRMTVTQVFIHLRLEQSVASQHLAILRRVGIVCTERDGKYIYYFLNYDRIAHIQEVVNNLLSK
jgi:ArsR family transcriptional regulator, virulence genes transcriptional regulator